MFKKLIGKIMTRVVAFIVLPVSGDRQQVIAEYLQDIYVSRGGDLTGYAPRDGESPILEFLRYLIELGTENDWAFLKWIIENLPLIIGMF